MMIVACCFRVGGFFVIKLFYESALQNFAKWSELEVRK